MRRPDHRSKRAAFVVPLGQDATGDRGLVGDLDRLAAAGLPVPEGFVLTEVARSEFVRLASETTSRATLGRGLDGAVRGALISLSAGRVMVRSGPASRRNLGTIPAVLSAVRSLWLRREATNSRARPALIQRDIRPERVVRVSRRSMDGMCFTVEDRETVSRLILEAEYVLGGPLGLNLELEGGRWHITSVVRDASDSFADGPE